MLSQITDTEQSDNTLFIDAVQKQGQTEVKLDKCFLAGQQRVNYIKQYQKVFEGLGCLSKPYHIQLDPLVQPVVTPLRSQPAALRNCLKVTLNEMEMLKGT